MKPNTYLILGMVGFAVTGFIHLFLTFMLDEKPFSMLPYYIVWIVFLIIGLGKKRSSPKS